MKKDKKWLKEEANAQNIILDKGYIYTEDILKLIDQLEEPEQEKVVVPQFVADWIEKHSNVDLLYVGFAFNSDRIEEDDIYEWIEDNKEVFTRAWLNGYTVEKEKLYRVVFPMGINPNKLIKKISTGAILVDSESYYSRDTNDEFTEQEIKAIDERYLAFKVEVTK